jgi:hypothetical protein
MCADVEIFKSELGLDGPPHFSEENAASFDNATGDDDLFGINLVEWRTKRKIPVEIPAWGDDGGSAADSEESVI